MSNFAWLLVGACWMSMCLLFFSLCCCLVYSSFLVFSHRHETSTVFFFFVFKCDLLELLDLLLRLLLHGREEVGVFLERGLGEAALAPQVRREVRISMTNREKRSLYEIAHCLRASVRLCVHVVHTRELEDLLGDARSDDSRTAGRGHEAHGHGAALASYLHGYSMGVTNHVTPISTTHGDDSKLGKNDSTANSSSNFLGALDTQANMPIRVANDYKGLETGPLTCAGLLLYWHDLHHLILQFPFQEEVDYLVFLDGEGEQVNLLEALD